MKKISILLAAATTASAAFAVNPVQKVATGKSQNMQKAVRSESVMKASAFHKDSQKSVAKSKSMAPGVDEPIVSSPLQNFSVGIDLDRRGFSSPFGLLPSKGTVTFTAEGDYFDTGVWTWNNGLIPEYYEEYSFEGLENVVTLKAPTIIQDMMFEAPDGTTGSPIGALYFAGAGAEYWGFEGADGCGATMYPLKDGGMREVMFDYCVKNTLEYTPGGAPLDWVEVLEDDVEGAVDDVTITGFYNIIPAMSSPYFFTHSWLWANAEFSAATELTMKVYPVNDNTISDTPIAIGHASVAKGATSDMIDFEILPVDEDGDEIDGLVTVNNQSIALVVEGFNENPAVKQFQMVFGNGTSFDYNNGHPVNPWFTNAYAGIQYTVDGETQFEIRRNPYNYWEDDARTSLWCSSNFYWMLDAKFPFVNNAANDSDVFDFTAPVEGGEIEVEVDALYFLSVLVEEGLMEYTVDGDWISVTVEDVDRTTGITPVKLQCQALPEGIEGRTAKVEFTGYAQDFTINVKQGEVSGVNEIQVANGAAVYYDLQGRKLNQAPEKGIYILKEGNKVSKVVR